MANVQYQSSYDKYFSEKEKIQRRIVNAIKRFFPEANNIVATDYNDSVLVTFNYNSYDLFLSAHDVFMSFKSPWKYDSGRYVKGNEQYISYKEDSIDQAIRWLDLAVTSEFADYK